jgi:hypothetical protein
MITSTVGLIQLYFKPINNVVVVIGDLFKPIIILSFNLMFIFLFRWYVDLGPDQNALFQAVSLIFII